VPQLFLCYIKDYKGKYMTAITLKGNTINTIGSLPPVGSPAPDFTLTKTDLGEVHLKNLVGQPIVLSIFPSLDTPTCAKTMKRFNVIAAKHKNILFLCISADLPFAQERFCTAEHLKNVVPASTFRHTAFGKDYGVLMMDGPVAGLLSRAAVVIDNKGKVIYTEQVSEIDNEPDYTRIENIIEKFTN
jgi:thiol peroxidase